MQRTVNDNSTENGLSYGNVAISKTNAETLNFEGGIFYQNEIAKILKLPNASFYRVELSAYHSHLYSSKDATVTQGNTNYSLSAKYNQGVVYGASALLSTPINDSTDLVTKIERRQNNSLRDVTGGVNLLLRF